MRKICLAIVILLCGLLMFAVVTDMVSCASSNTTQSNSSTLDEIARAAWLKQEGTGMFFGTGPDDNQSSVECSASWGNDPNAAGAGILDVAGLASQFPDGTTLWLKFTCPSDNFGSDNITFQIMKCQMDSEGGIISQQYVTQFSAVVDPETFIVRLQMPAFSIGPGTYSVSAYTNGNLRLSRLMAYLAAGEQPNPNFQGGY